MSADDLRPETPKQDGRGWTRTVLLMALPLMLVWAAAFWVTGLLWWSPREDAVEQSPPPAPPAIEATDATTIDLERYTRARPTWQP